MSKRVLIITDGNLSIMKIAEAICGTLKKYKVKIVCAGEFEGTDILPVDMFFIGSENSTPGCFSYLEEMLAHINFASRKCGVFSVNEKPLNYLCDIVKDCEADVGSPLLVTSKDIQKQKLEKWVKGIINL